MTYGELVILMGYSVGAANTIKQPLGNIAAYCMHNDIPLLHSVVVGDKTGSPGEGVILRPGSSVEGEQNAVLEFGRKWFAIKTPEIEAIKEAVNAQR